jgi:hypothetical protein
VGVVAFDYFKGWTADQTPTPEDVNRRAALAKTLLGNQIQAQNPLGVIADALAGAGSASLNSQAAEEQTAGRNASNAQIAQLLAPGTTPDPGAMIGAAGNGFMNDTQSGLVGDLFKRKLGIGETYYGTPIITTDAQGNQHLYQPGSLGDTREMNFGGNTPAPQQTFLNTGTGFQAVPNRAGVALPGAAPGGATPADGASPAGGAPVPLAPLPPQIPINNAQAKSDEAFGTASGTQAANAPINLQAEQQGVQTLDNQHQIASSAIKDALNSASGFTTGTLGSVLNSVPGTPAYDLKQKLTTLQAIVGFQTLQAIRNASKTGGGLGQISDFEERLLSAVQGSFDPGQSPQQFVGNLQNLQKTLDQLSDQAHQNYQQDYARGSKAPPAAPALGSNTPLPAVVQNVPAPTPGPGAGGKTFTYNPATGQLE